MNLVVNPTITNFMQKADGEVIGLEVNGENLYKELEDKFMDKDKKLEVEMTVAEDTEHDGKVIVTITTSEKDVVIFYSLNKANATLLSGSRTTTGTGKTVIIDNLTQDADKKLYILAVKEKYQMVSDEVSLA